MKKGILAAGNFIVDRVKIIESYPEEGTLTSILREQQANGGGPYNVLKDLSAMDVDFPLEALALIGKDDTGDWILEDCKQSGIDTQGIQQIENADTSYTDVMSVEETGKRTFFHYRGANQFLGLEHFDFRKTTSRIFYLSHLMLLDKMDTFISGDLTSENRTEASYVLEKAQEAGMLTSVDLVSSKHPKFAEIAKSALPYTDYFIANEVEAGWILNRNLVGKSFEIIGEAALEIQKAYPSSTVIIHFEEGAVAVDTNAKLWSQISLNLPEGFIKGSVGAGDAFAAGLLYGVHEAWDLQKSLHLGICTAAASLQKETPSCGVLPMPECLDLATRYSK